jgi:choice-of-anchor A domain-containing protein
MTIGGSSFSFRDFNAISFGDFTANTGDVEGRLAVKGDVSLGAGYSIGAELQTVNNQPDNSLPFALVAGGDVAWISGELFPSGNGIPHAGAREDMFVGSGSFTGADNLVARATGSCGASATGCLDAAFDAAKTCYSGYSNTAASKSDNVAKEYKWTGLFVTCADNTETEYVISLTPVELASFTYTVLSNCNFQAGWIINVRGSGDVTLTGDSWPAIPGATLYNIIGDRTVNVYATSVTGHVLAVDATLNQSGGVIIGKVVANNIVASLQINKQNTCPASVTVQLPIVAAAAAQQGSTTMQVVGVSAFRVGDVTTFGTIVAINGDIVTFDTPLPRPVSAGAFIGYASVDSSAGRAYVANPADDSSSASVVGVAAAALFLSALVL